MKTFLNFSKKYWQLFLPMCVLAVLLLRNPYSTRTLIPNLEPFPDAFYYTTPPRCFLQGQGWNMCRMHNSEIEGISPAVPPAYSLTFIPGYILNFDVRTFYFTNILLAFISLSLLYKVSKNFFQNQLITGIILFFYATNYFTYWYPTLAMAENLLSPLFLLSILILQQNKITKKTSLLASLVSVGFYATKFAFIPLAVLFPIIYSLKILTAVKENKERVTQVSIVVLPTILCLLSLTNLTGILNVFNQLLNGALDSNSSKSTVSGGGFFSINYFPEHILKYSYALVGKSQRFLWDSTPLTEKYIALPALFGIIVALRKKVFQPTKIWLVTAIIAQLMFISTFYVVDIRYVYHFLPILLLGFGFFLQHLGNTLLRDKTYFFIFLFCIFAIYLITNVMRLKSTVMVNLKYSETPWWYLSQLEMNTFFDSLEKKDKKPVLITLSAPFLTDNYTNQNYTTLPLNDQQDFHGSFSKVWGGDNFTSLLLLYKEKISNEFDVYVTNYGVSAAGSFKQSYADIQDNFTLIQVQSGCYDLCNIYKLETIH